VVLYLTPHGSSLELITDSPYWFFCIVLSKVVEFLHSVCTFLVQQVAHGFCMFCSLHHGERQRYMDYGCQVGSHLMSSGGVFKRSMKREWHKVGPCIFTLAFGFGRIFLLDGL
jgi:hypothetical protein